MTINADYPCDRRNYARGRTQPVEYLVIHYVGATGGAEANAKYYANANVGASAHYFVGHGPDAEVWASVGEGETAWHCGRMGGRYKHPECRNANSIGIEMCCRQDKAGKWYFDPETVDRTVELARAIMARYGIDAAHVLRHYDVTGKVCPAPFVHDAKAWGEFKKRLEGTDMTREEVQAIVDEAVEAAKPKVYTELSEVPKWAQEAVGRAMDGGVLHGDEGGRLHLTDDHLVTLQMLGNLKLF